MHTIPTFLAAVGCLLLPFVAAKAQNGTPNSPTERVAEIHDTIRGKVHEFSSTDPPLMPTLGAPPAFYTYFWEFGDGHYSTEQHPTHRYRNVGSYAVQLELTNNYDDGKPPKGKPFAADVNILTADATAEYASYLPRDTALSIRTDRQPRPNENLTGIITYKNTQTDATDGRIYVFYNESGTPRRSFRIEAARAYYGEHRLEHGGYYLPKRGLLSSISTTPAATDANIFTTDIATAPLPYPTDEGTETLHLDGTPKDVINALEDGYAQYKDVAVWVFNDLKADEERTLFLSLRTLAALRDTNSTVGLRVVVVQSCNNVVRSATTTLSVVKSHDPNHLTVDTRLIDLRHTRRNTLTYKVRFQNTGEGAARFVTLECPLPDGVAEGQLVKLVRFTPLCPICKNSDGSTSSEPVKGGCVFYYVRSGRLVVQFRNIYLPTVRSSDENDRRNSIGTLVYQVELPENIPTGPMPTRTEITFDNNPSLRTNKVVTRVKPGTSPAVMLGWNFDTGASFDTIITRNHNTDTRLHDDAPTSNITLGVVVAPYKPYRVPYLQFELAASFRSFTRTYQTIQYDSLGGGYTLIDKSSRLLTQTLIHAVPIHIRYNAFRGFGIGAGLQLTLNVSDWAAAKHYDPRFLTPEIFGDLAFGTVRLGPTVGLRYSYTLRPEQHFFTSTPDVSATADSAFPNFIPRGIPSARLYAMWRF